MYNVVHKTVIHTDCVTNRAGSCGGILKMLQNVIINCGVRTEVIALRSACLLQIYEFPIGDGGQKQRHDNLDVHCSENTHDKSSLLPCLCHMLHLTPSECGRVQPRRRAAC